MESKQNKTSQETERDEVQSLYPIQKVLIAEDDSINRTLIIKFLQRNYPELTLYKAENGKEAVDQYIKSIPDLVLMDLQMPVLNGYEAADLIRKANNRKKPVIIALTAEAVSGTREKCLANGMDDYIVKPFKKADFTHVLEKFIRKMCN